MANASASHGSRNTGPSASRGMLGTSCVARRAAVLSIMRLQIRLPGFDADPHRRIAVLAPQFAAVESHGIEPVRILAGIAGIGIGKHVAADDAHHLADMPA